MKGRVKFSFIILLILLVAQAVWSGITGKITGVVRDEATKEPLPGATVQVLGTKLGAITKAPDGNYVILNVPPGSYDVKISFVGYQDIQVKGMNISADVTTNLDAKMRATAVEMPAETVQAVRPVIEKGETANLRRIGSEAIENMSVKNLDELLSVQVGFVNKNNELHVRGGRAGEVAYVIDGVSTRDPLGGLGAVRGGTSVPASDISEVSILKGGFDAEYGNVTSAIINIVTKQGSADTKGHVEYITDDFGDRKLNKYSFNSDRLSLSLNGPDPFLTKYLFPALGINFAGEKLSYYASFEVYKTDSYVGMNNFAPADARKHFRSDDLLSITWPGFFSYRSGIKIPDRFNNLYNGSLKLTYKATATRSLTFSYHQTVNDYTATFNPSYETRGDIDIWNYRFTPSTLPVYHEKDVTTSLSYSENVGRNSLLEVQLSRFYKQFRQLPGSPTEPGGVVYPGDFLFAEQWESQSPIQDANHNGKWDAAEPYTDVNGNGKYDVGEPFEDVNHGKNAVWDPGEPFTEVNGDSGYQKGADIFSASTQDLPGEGKWDNAEGFTDTNGDGILNPERLSVAEGAQGVDNSEAFTDGDIFLGEPFNDVNKNGVFEAFEPFIDAVSPDGTVKMNGVYDSAWEYFQDLNGNNHYDKVLDTWIACSCPDNQDLNHDGEYNGPNEPFPPNMPFIPGKTVLDLNHNGKFDYANGIWDPGEPYADQNGNGQYDFRDGFYDRGYERRSYYEDRRVNIWTLKGSFTSQVRREHEIKTGLEMTYNELKMADLRYPYYTYNGRPDGGPWPDHGVFRDFFTREPVQGAFYLQDKIEYGTMIAKLGVRYDFYLQSKDLVKLTEATPVGDSKSEEGFVETITGQETVKSRNRVSPRLGVSYPVSDVAKVYFNYGHFYQLPELRFMFSRATQGSSAVGIIGNYNLNYQKVIQYELGVQYAMSGEYTLDVSGFYKDQFGLTNTQQIYYQGRSWDFYSNNDYGRSRGLEIQLDKKRGAYINGYVNYQYAYAYGKNSAEVSNYYAALNLGGVQFIPLKEYPLDWDVRHQITFNLDFRVRKGDHPHIFGVKVPDNWGINLLWQYGSGYPFTPDRTYPGITEQLQGRQTPTNYLRLPARSTVDLRLNKDFDIWKTSYSLTLYVYNLFNRANVLEVYDTTGRPDTSLNQSGLILPGTERDRNPLNLGPGRNIQLGISMNF